MKKRTRRKVRAFTQTDRQKQKQCGMQCVGALPVPVVYTCCLVWNVSAPMLVDAAAKAKAKAKSKAAPKPKAKVAATKAMAKGKAKAKGQSVGE